MNERGKWEGKVVAVVLAVGSGSGKVLLYMYM
jgi:hypothetical protein